MVLVFGTICLDRVRRIRTLPASGGYASVQEEQVILGGEAANTACALHCWGDEFVLTGNGLGAGAEAETLIELIREKGLPANLLSTSGTQTPCCDIYVTPDGDRTMFGIGFETIGNEVEVDLLPVTGGGWFTTDSNLGATARRAYDLAARSGMNSYLMDFLDAADRIQPDDFWQSSTDWAGVRGNTQKNVEYVRRKVEDWGCFVVLSDGPNGLVAGSPSLPVRHFPPFPAPAYVDSTGAGDMFRAGMLHGLTRNWPISKCLQFASAAGCLKCKSLGATTMVPTKLEIEAHIARNAQIASQYL